MRRVVALSLIAAAAVALAPSPLRIRDRLAAGVRRPAAKDYYAFRRENDETVLDRTDEETEVTEDDAEAPLVRGQSLYHERHKKEIEDGILSHLTELGLTLKEAAEALMGGHADDVVAFSETNEYRDLRKHARAMEQEHLRELLEDPQRFKSMSLETKDCGVFLDWTRQKVAEATMAKTEQATRRIAMLRRLA